MGRDYIPKAKTLGVPEPTPPETAQIRQISEGQNKRVRAAQVPHAVTVRPVVPRWMCGLNDFSDSGISKFQSRVLAKGLLIRNSHPLGT